ncbi:SPOR domain-containing protein [Pseudomonas bohemica]|uniref:SPOR domain-containing protein n=1 Tax=Pseudomonas bohemica TaxID=2044872 RepID=UPI000DA5F46D|nr:SPOR domain-containing protein [Pseudomonas bohemica]
MHNAMLSKTHLNGYDVINVNNGPWRVCTHHDRLGSFQTREEAMAFAASLPAYKERTAMRAAGGDTSAQKNVPDVNAKTRH